MDKMTGEYAAITLHFISGGNNETRQYTWVHIPKRNFIMRYIFFLLIIFLFVGRTEINDNGNL